MPTIFTPNINHAQPDQILSLNEPLLKNQQQFNTRAESIEARGFNVPKLLHEIGNFQVAIPSWALGTGGTRFGRFHSGGEPGSLSEKYARN